MMKMKILCGVLLVFVACVSSQGFKKVCYFTNWAQYRTGLAKFFPDNVDVKLCTHAVFAFAKLQNNELRPVEWNDESTPKTKGMYELFNDLKKKKRDLKTLLAVGGWNAGTGEMTKMLSSKQNRDRFVSTTIKYLRSRNFDGLDLDFEYPGSRGSPAQDKQRYTMLVQELRQSFKKEKLPAGKGPLLLTAAVAAGKDSIDKGYEVDKIAKELDYISLMSYDYHGFDEKVTGHNAPLYSKDEKNVDWSARYWVSKGVPPSKLIIGMPMYGRCFTLSDPKKTYIGAPARGPCPAGKYTKEAGFRAYFEICELLKNKNVKKSWSETMKVPYLVDGTTWVGYDNEKSLKEKVKYLKSKNYGGWMVWDLSLDDFSGKFCGGGNYPLVHAL